MSKKRAGISWTNRNEYQEALRAYWTSLPNQAQSAVNLTAYQVRDALVAEMRTRFDRPTPYTLNAPYVRAGTGKGRVMKASVLMREQGGKRVNPEKYLMTQVEGGRRRGKRFEMALRRIGVLPEGLYAVPGERAPLDAYGNLSPGFIVQILSYFRAFGEAGYRANITDKKKQKMAAGTKKKRGVKYFVIRRRGRGLHPGIWRSTHFGFGWSVEPMIMFVKRPAYQRLLPWHEIVDRVVRDRYDLNFSAVGDVGSTLSPRGGAKP